MKFKVGDVVVINPNWDKRLGDYGISTWKKFLNKEFVVKSIREHDVTLQNSGFIWPKYMLIPINENSIMYYLNRRHNENYSR